MPKHLHPILGRRMVDWIVEAARPLEPDSLVVVVSPDTADEFTGLTTAVQERALGTGRCGAVRRGGGRSELMRCSSSPATLRC
jgi:bifunctional N-acetylglucosamine-1-phosphate-uridyltransferase/glucosamine-1-phosphate-acetyltransferase GlmU-like protein